MIKAKIKFVLLPIICIINASALLVDDFSDENEDDTVLTAGSDISLIRRELFGDCTLSKNALTANGNDSSQEIKYILDKGASLNFNDVHLINFDFSVFPTSSTPFSCEVILSTVHNAQRAYSFDLSKKDNIVGIDLTSGICQTFHCPEQSTFYQDQIKSIEFIFNDDNDSIGKYTLNRIEAVPEPFSIATLASGIITLIRKRRKNLNL